MQESLPRLKYYCLGGGDWRELKAEACARNRLIKLWFSWLHVEACAKKLLPLQSVDDVQLKQGTALNRENGDAIRNNFTSEARRMSDRNAMSCIFDDEKITREKTFPWKKGRKFSEIKNSIK